MEHYIVVHAVSDQPIGETFQRLFNTAEDAKKFAIRVADSYKVDYPDAKITVSEDSVRVDYGEGIADYLSIQQVVDDSTDRHCPHCGGDGRSINQWTVPLAMHRVRRGLLRLRVQA